MELDSVDYILRSTERTAQVSPVRKVPPTAVPS